MVTRYYRTNLDTFHRVEEMYNTTKPIVSKKHPLHHDIRPLGPRNRKWERIKKFSYNCYGLMDGGSYDGLGEHTRHGTTVEPHNPRTSNKNRSLHRYSGHTMERGSGYAYATR